MIGSAEDIEFFEDALKEEGLRDFETLQYTTPDMQEVYAVKKIIDGEPYVAEQTISHQERDQIDNPKQHIALLAARAARNLQEHITELHKWGENVVNLDLNEEYSATCRRCGAEVTMDDMRGGHTVGEITVPNPHDTGYKSLPKPKLRMTLLALLKNECEPYCPNSPRDERDWMAPKDLSTRSA